LPSWLPSQDGAQFIKASLPAIITYRNPEYRLSGFCAKAASHLQWPDRPGLTPGSPIFLQSLQKPGMNHYLVFIFFNMIFTGCQEKIYPQI